MPPVKERLESFLGGLLSSIRGHDASLLTQNAPFKNHPEPTITITAPESGPSGSELKLHHTPLGENRFPELNWKAPSNAPVVAEYLVMVEDPDAPLPSLVVHGVYYSIPASKNSLLPSDFEKIGGKGNSLSGGFKYGANRMKSVWGGPRPVMGHGVHRYMFQVVALSVKVEDEGGLLSEVPTKAELEKVVAGRVVGWGIWQYRNGLKIPRSPTKAALRSLSDTLSQEMDLYASASRPAINLHTIFPATIFTEFYEAENRVKSDLTKKLEEDEGRQTAGEVSKRSIAGLEQGEELVTTTFMWRSLMISVLGGSIRNGWTRLILS